MNLIVEPIFPNPNPTGFCHIQLKTGIPFAFYQIVDLKGVLVCSGYLPVRDNFVDLRNIDEGKYFLHLTYQQLTQTLPLFVQK